MTKNKKALEKIKGFSLKRVGLFGDDGNLLGAGFAFVGRQFIRNDLIFRQRAQTRRLNRGNVNENVFAAFFGLNKAVTFGIVEPLNRTFCHC